MRIRYSFSFAPHENVVLPTGEHVPLYRVGQTISGVARIVAIEQIKINGISVSVGYRIKGTCNPEEAFAPVGGLQLQYLEPNVPIDIPFTYVLPPFGPISYKGVLMTIDWMVRVVVDIPWAFDDEGFAIFLVGSA